MTDPLAALLHNFSPALCRHGETEECGERAKALRDAGVTLAPAEGLREAARAVVHAAEADDDFDGQFINYLVPYDLIDALRAALKEPTDD